MAAFYHKKSQSQGEDGHAFHIELNAQHPVYEGHFPGQPVAPGVMLTRMIQELTEEISGSKLFLAEARSIKFLKFVDPTATPTLDVHIQLIPDEEVVKINSRADFEGATYFKLNATFNKIS
ncbi:MAG: 3-hydroxyacyl-ACP dehydratase [Flavobacteriales bacterium]|nr:3-hydroxyacyl-ACP dehydratase [Flavobacteriales bacterium]